MKFISKKTRREVEIRIFYNRREALESTAEWLMINECGYEYDRKLDAYIVGERDLDMMVNYAYECSKGVNNFGSDYSKALIYVDGKLINRSKNIMHI